MNAEGELKKRVVQEARIDIDDIKQIVTLDRVLQIKIPEEKYLVSLKDLWVILNEAKKEHPPEWGEWLRNQPEWQTYPKKRIDLHDMRQRYAFENHDWFERWFGGQEEE